MNGYCSDCGEKYELDALNLDLRCADCVEQLVIDNLEREGEQVIKIDTIGREWCLPCADGLEIEGVIVEREGECLGCERERVKVWAQFQRQEREGAR